MPYATNSGDARVVSDVSVLCPRSAVRFDNSLDSLAASPPCAKDDRRSSTPRRPLAWVASLCSWMLRSHGEWSRLVRLHGRAMRAELERLAPGVLELGAHIVGDEVAALDS